MFVPCFAPVRHRNGRSRFDADNPAPGILVITIGGFGDDDVADLLMDCAARTTDAFGDYEAFHDWSAMTGYATSARTRLTALSQRQRNRVNILVESLIISMGVSVASLAVPTLKGFSDRRAFETARDAAIAAALGPAPARV
jgi:hypothetical protein